MVSVVGAATSVYVVAVGLIYEEVDCWIWALNVVDDGVDAIVGFRICLDFVDAY